jgi:hypothetical protein
VGENDRRDPEVHGSDADAQATEPLLFDACAFVEIEDEDASEAVEMYLEPGVCLDFLSDRLRPSHVGHPAPGLFFVGDNGRGPRAGVKTIQPILEDLTSDAPPSFEQGQVIRVENDHRFSSSVVLWAGMTPAIDVPVSWLPQSPGRRRRFPRFRSTTEIASRSPCPARP